MDTLQFQKAVYAGDRPKCLACQSPIDREYYELAGQTLCPSCAEKVRSGQERPPAPALLRGLLYGAGAALGCTILYATVIMVTGLELGLVAILVGWLVGRAVRKGTNGLGDRRCQIMAVALTYFAITFSYVPVAIRAAVQARATEAAEAKSKGADAPKQAAPTVGLALGLVMLTGYMTLVPFLALRSGFSGIIGLVIIGIGMHQAWKLTGRDPRPLTGPHQWEGAAPVG